MRRSGVDLPTPEMGGSVATTRAATGIALAEDECLALLATTDLGRVGVSIGALPVILPVTYRLLDGALVFYAGDGAQLRAALTDTVVAFQADCIDPSTRAGWSVSAVGVARASTDRTERAAALRAGLTPPAPPPTQAEPPSAPKVAAAGHLVALRPVIVSGSWLAATSLHP